LIIFLTKETTHRSHELKEFDWNQDEITRYEELWEYSQRWGLINLEREDRQFLKKAEKLIPKLQPKKTSVKKSIEEKSYYLWLNFYLEKIRLFNERSLSKDIRSVWEILIQEELELLVKWKPVMGLPDTLKAKELFKVRKDLLDLSFKSYEAKNNNDLFDFDIVLNHSEQNISKTWKSLIVNMPDERNNFPIINEKYINKFVPIVNTSIETFMKDNYPSLKDNL